VEPWLSGSRTETPAAGRAVLHALDLAKHDIEKWIAGLTDEQLNAQPYGLPSIAFHLRHIARSTDRILTYAEGEQLSDVQLAALKAEKGGEAATRAQLLDEIRAAFSSAESRIRALASADFDTPRAVGRKQLPTSVGGALIHVADHTQRHVGQVVTTAKVLKALAAS
jgi:uncharacterized damage-inducible protein DinB